MNNPTDLDSEIDAILAKHRSETWQTGWNNDASDKAKAAIQAIIARECDKARIDEIVLFSQNTSDLLHKETWGQWAYRVTDYFEDRLAHLKAEAAQKGAE